MMTRVLFSLAYGKLWIAYLPQERTKAGESHDEEVSDEQDEESTPEKTQLDHAGGLPPVLKKERPLLEQLPEKKKKQQQVRRICMCPFIQSGTKCKFEKLNNNAALLKHECPLLDHVLLSTGKTVPRTSPLAIIQQKQILNLTQPQERVMSLLVDFFAQTPLSFLHLGSHAFNALVNGLVQIGQKYPVILPTKLIPYITRHKVPQLLEQRAAKLYQSLLKGIQGQFVSVLFDAGEINHNHYASICLQPFGRNSAPVFFQLAYGPWSKAEYTSFIQQLLESLQLWSVHVACFCTDGLPAQTQAIKDCITSMRTTGTFGPIRPLYIPFHVYCMNHKINLVVQQLYKLPYTKNIIESLIGFSHSAQKKDYREILHKACPTFIPTRWLSLFLLAAYVRLKRKIIIHTLLTPDTIKAILQLEILLAPLMELHLFFESHSTKLCDVYPAVLRSLLQYNHLIQEKTFCNSDNLYAIVEIMTSLYNFLLTGELGNLIRLAFYLSPVGKVLYCSHITPAFNPMVSLENNLRYINEHGNPFDASRAFVPLNGNNDIRSTVIPEQNPVAQIPDPNSNGEQSKNQTPSSQSEVRSYKHFLLDIPHSADNSATKVLSDSAMSVSAFRRALEADPMKSPSVTLPTDAIETVSVVQNERLLMPLSSLLSVFIACERDPEYLAHDVAIAVEDYLGLISEEEEAILDGYEEDREYEIPESSHQYSTRQSSNREDSSSSSVTTTSHSGSDEEIILEEDVVLVGVSGSIHHKAYTNDTTELKTAEEIFIAIGGIHQSSLQQQFTNHVRDVLPTKFHSWIPSLERCFLKDLKASELSLHSQTIVKEMQQPQLVQTIYSTIVTCLVYAPCSESECERIFSKAKHICGDRRHNLLLKTLNCSLAVTYLSGLFS